MENIFEKLREKEAYDKFGPSLDKVQCSNCQRKFYVKDCPTEPDGDWETGYFDVPICPNCEDGGCLDHYYFSPSQERKYLGWLVEKQDKEIEQLKEELRKEKKQNEIYEKRISTLASKQD